MKRSKKRYYEIKTNSLSMHNESEEFNKNNNRGHYQATYRLLQLYSIIYEPNLKLRFKSIFVTAFALKKSAAIAIKNVVVDNAAPETLNPHLNAIQECTELKKIYDIFREINLIPDKPANYTQNHKSF